MNPVDVQFKEAPGALLGAVVEPVPGWVAVICLLAITAVLLTLAARQLRRTEISYSSD
jgi:hypothetical protein